MVVGGKDNRVNGEIIVRDVGLRVCGLNGCLAMWTEPNTQRIRRHLEEDHGQAAPA